MTLRPLNSVGGSSASQYLNFAAIVLSLNLQTVSMSMGATSVYMAVVAGRVGSKPMKGLTVLVGSPERSRKANVKTFCASNLRLMRRRTAKDCLFQCNESYCGAKKKIP